jgi:hypothetical protein
MLLSDKELALLTWLKRLTILRGCRQNRVAGRMPETFQFISKVTGPGLCDFGVRSVKLGGHVVLGLYGMIGYAGRG